MLVFVFSSRRRHTRCALVTGVQTCALPISDITRAAEAARAKLGSIDILLNSTASNYAPDLLMRTPIEDISGIFDRLVLPPIYLTRVVLPWMREQKSGSIINMASDAAKTGHAGEPIAGAGMARRTEGQKGAPHPQSG